MAISIQSTDSSSGNGSSFGRVRKSFTKRTTQSTLSEINVTPLVDVMLVLLIIFMVSAPLMQQGMTVDLPKANTGTLKEADEQLLLVITKDHKLQINGNSINPKDLSEKLVAIAKAKPDTQVYIHADQNVTYGYLAQVMAAVKQSKLYRVGLVTEPSDRDPKL